MAVELRNEAKYLGLFLFTCVVILLAACLPVANQAQTPAKAFTTEAPAGAYTLDPAHADLSFRVSHLGFSVYTARFAEFTAELYFDPATPRAMRVNANIDPCALLYCHHRPRVFSTPCRARNGWIPLSIRRLAFARQVSKPLLGVRCG